ncbi:putative transposase orfA for insertion sequence element [Oscillibacter valericigenes Sjm18-20]|nr:putative transposase orfA for insertion sequence element [Oscillibacter valericigenes Sjm18-20]
MRKYDKEFKEEAVKLSDEIGVKQAAAQLGIPYYSPAKAKGIWRPRLRRQRHSPRRAAFRERAPADKGNRGTAESQ